MNFIFVFVLGYHKDRPEGADQAVAEAVQAVQAAETFIGSDKAKKAKKAMKVRCERRTRVMVAHGLCVIKSRRDPQTDGVVLPGGRFQVHV